MFILHELFSQERWESLELPTFTPNRSQPHPARRSRLHTPLLTSAQWPTWTRPRGADDIAKIRYKSGLPPPLRWLHIYFPDLPTFLREKEQEGGRQQEEWDPTAVLRPVAVGGGVLVPIVSDKCGTVKADLHKWEGWWGMWPGNVGEWKRDLLRGHPHLRAGAGQVHGNLGESHGIHRDCWERRSRSSEGWEQLLCIQRYTKKGIKLNNFWQCNLITVIRHPLFTTIKRTVRMKYCRSVAENSWVSRGWCWGGSGGGASMSLISKGLTVSLAWANSHGVRENLIAGQFDTCLKKSPVRFREGRERSRQIVLKDHDNGAFLS